MRSYLSLPVIVTAVLALSGDVLGTCDHSIIHRIVERWGNEFPTDVLKRSVGIMTYVYLSPVFLRRDDKNIYCLATKLADDRTSATDIYVYRDLATTRTVTYNKYENTGKVTLRSSGMFDETQIVVSFKNNVFVFWQCLPDDTTGNFDSLVGIGVDVEHVDDLVARTEVEAAKKTLESLGLATGADLIPCIPDVLRRVNML